MPENFKERRMDPEELLSLDIHAGRALQRKEFQGLGRRARRRAIGGAVFREGDRLREKLFSILDCVEKVRSPEQRKLLGKLMGQRKRAAALWTRKFPLESAPAKDRIMDSAKIFLQGLPNKVLQAFVELCPKSAGLVVIPGGVSVSELLRIVDENKIMVGQRNSLPCASVAWKKVQRNGWGFGITDLTENPPFDSDIFYLDREEDETTHVRRVRHDRDMINAYERMFTGKSKGKGVNIMPRHGYVPSLILGLVGGKILDRDCCTVFRESLEEYFSPPSYAHWSNGVVNLCDRFPDGVSTSLRCRPWYEEDMIL